MTTKSKKTKNFIANLKRLIKHHEVSIRGMSKATNLDRAHLNRLIQGKHSNPGLESLEKIANFFKVSVAQLIGEQEINFSQTPKLSNDGE
ncbi:hypothetical protein GAMM_170089 [Gammaproteobacteria bacterium]